MSLATLIKRLQDIMRKDSGVDGDAQRLAQIVWLIFLKVYDYKSDAKNGKPDDEFEKALAEKYEGQLALYRYAVSKAFDVEEKSVKTELISLYR